MKNKKNQGNSNNKPQTPQVSGPRCLTTKFDHLCCLIPGSKSIVIYIKRDGTHYPVPSEVNMALPLVEPVEWVFMLSKAGHTLRPLTADEQKLVAGAVKQREEFFKKSLADRMMIMHDIRSQNVKPADQNAATATK